MFAKRPASVMHPFASLAISAVAPRTGQVFVASGFPLGSLTPTIQLALVAATETIYPNGMSAGLIHGDGRDHLHISVKGNHGNSDGPVIDLNSGQLLGVIDQLVPAPLQLGGKQILDAKTFSASGIMLASPAKWVEALLEKNHLKTEGIPAGRLVIN